MNNITINNYGTVNIYNTNDTSVAEAKDKLLAKMYYARNKDTMGNRDGWLKLLDMYFTKDWEGMYNHIQACKGKGGKTRHDCLKYIETIMKGDTK